MAAILRFRRSAVGLETGPDAAVNREARSMTDLPLLERVKTPVVVNPDRRLRRVAGKRGWRVESW